MAEHKISTLHVGALGCWVVALVLVGLNMAYLYRTAQLGLLFAGVGMLLNIRAFIDDLESRERRAFDFGRQLGAAAEDVKRIH